MQKQGSWPICYPAGFGSSAGGCFEPGRRIWSPSIWRWRRSTIYKLRRFCCPTPGTTDQGRSVRNLPGNGNMGRKIHWSSRERARTTVRCRRSCPKGRATKFISRGERCLTTEFGFHTIPQFVLVLGGRPERHRHRSAVHTGEIFMGSPYSGRRTDCRRPTGSRLCWRKGRTPGGLSGEPAERPSSHDGYTTGWDAAMSWSREGGGG